MTADARYEPGWAARLIGGENEALRSVLEHLRDASRWEPYSLGDDAEALLEFIEQRPEAAIELARSYWRVAHEWSCAHRHGGLCTSNGGDAPCEFPPDESIVAANAFWLESTDEGFNYLEYGRWWREEAVPVWPSSPGTKPRYR